MSQGDVTPDIEHADPCAELRAALAELRRTADRYQATIRPSVHGVPVETVHRWRAELQAPLLDALGRAHDVLNAR